MPRDIFNGQIMFPQLPTVIESLIKEYLVPMPDPLLMKWRYDQVVQTINYLGTVNKMRILKNLRCILDWRFTGCDYFNNPIIYKCYKYVTVSRCRREESCFYHSNSKWNGKRCWCHSSLQIAYFRYQCKKKNK